ncbi:MAG: hypothetical protein IJC01_01110 [Clostridia bacterium]|nr:hypothetical protein [Clostridia bacterium]
MKSKLVLTLVSIALTMAVFGGCLALYIINGEGFSVNIGFGEIVELKMIAQGDSQDGTLNPENFSQSYTITLDKFDDTLADVTEGKFYVQITSESALSREVVFSLKENDEGGKTYTHDEICTMTDAQPSGAVYTLKDLPMNLTLTYSLSEKVKNNYIDYAEQEVSFTLNWVISQDEVDTTRTVHYKPSSDEECDLFVQALFDDDVFSKNITYMGNGSWLSFEMPHSQIAFMVECEGERITYVTIEAGTGDVWVVGGTVSDTEPEG